MKPPSCGFFLCAMMETENFYVRLFRQNERVMKFGLDAMQKALGREPELVTYPHILVAGTNGKGQTSAIFATALRMIGCRAGLFTSPHLVEFRERMRVDGRLLSSSEIEEIGWDVLKTYGGDEIPEFSGVSLTYFECCLMMALRAFKRERVEFGVFEVGLGGRLDATNVLSPGLSIITSISRDHEAYLGHETAQIAREKAGIMRAGVPVVCGRNEREVLRMEAERIGCSSMDALGDEFDWIESDNEVYLESKYGHLLMTGANKLPDYQRDNASVSLFSLMKSAEIGLLPERVNEVLSDVVRHTKWVGRMWPCSEQSAQTIGVHEIVLDGAHNEDGVRAFMQAVRSREHGEKKALVVNSCEDKSIEQMFSQYSDFERSQIFVVPIKTTKRACAPEAYCCRVGLDVHQACASIEQGIRRAADSVGRDGTIYISGSLYLLGEVIECLDEKAAMMDIYIE